MFTGIRQAAVGEVPPPGPPGDHEVRIRMAAVGVCGSDIHYFTDGKIGDQVVQFPFVVGHEGAGTVVETGRKVTRVRPGERIAVEPSVFCGECQQCRVGRHHTCLNNLFLGCPGQLGGCLVEEIVMPEANCFPVPGHLSWEEAAFVEPLTIGCYTAEFVKNPQDKRVGILGAGPIGMSVLAALRGLGATRFWVTDKLDYRLEIARRMGAGWVGNPLKSDVVADISAGQPELLDVVVECCGQQAALDQAVHLLKPGGLLLIVGIPESFSISFEPHLLRRKELTIRNVRRQNHCTQKAIDLLDGRTIDFSPLFTHRFELKNSPAAFDLVAGYQDHVLKATVFLT